MRIALWNWHSPYVALLARALPEHHFYVMPTTHAPTGWRHDQRPLPKNVSLGRDPAYAEELPPLADVLLLQTGADIVGATWHTMPTLFLAHNRADLESPELPNVLRSEGWPLVCISEMKAATYRTAGYTHPITVIPPYVLPEDYPVWTGEEPHVLTVCNGLRRPLFDLEAWLAVTQDLPVRLVGEGNDGIRGAVGPAPSWEALKGEYRRARVYLNPTRPPYEDAYNLASLEAAATGSPVANLHGGYGLPWAYSPGAVLDFLQGVTMRSGEQQLAQVAAAFPQEVFAAYWRAVLREVSGG